MMRLACGVSSSPDGGHDKAVPTLRFVQAASCKTLLLRLVVRSAIGFPVHMGKCRECMISARTLTCRSSPVSGCPSVPHDERKDARTVSNNPCKSSLHGRYYGFRTIWEGTSLPAPTGRPPIALLRIENLFSVSEKNKTFGITCCRAKPRALQQHPDSPFLAGRIP
jgi:hypothetical protein